MTSIIIWALLIIGVLIISIFLGIALLRKRKAYTIIVTDLRNPTQHDKKFYGIFDKGIDSIKLYVNLFQPFKTRLLPPFDMGAYLWDGRVYCLQGVSGDPEDSANIVPIHKPLVSAAGAQEMSRAMSNAVSTNIKLMNQINDKFYIGQKVAYTDTKKEEWIGRVSDITWQGVTISLHDDDSKKENYIVCEKCKFENLTDAKYCKECGTVLEKRSDTKKSRKISAKKIAQLPLGELIGIYDNDKDLVSFIVPKKELKYLNPTNEKDTPKKDANNFTSFFNSDWIMQAIGIVPVENVNVVLNNTKSAVASFNSLLNEKESQHLSWLAKYQNVFGFAMMSLIIVVSLSIVYYSTAQYLGGLAGTTQQAETSLVQYTEGVLGHNAGGVTTSVTTTIPTTVNINTNSTVGNTPP